MFQTDLVHALQAYRAEWLSKFLSLVNLLGYSEFQIPFVLLIIFGVSYRKGFLITQVLLYNSVFTGFLKSSFALPRPEGVDSTLWPSAGQQTASRFVERDAPGFFSMLPDDVINYYRTVPGHSFGLPSGHVSSTVTLFGGIAVAWRKWTLAIIALAISFLVAVARMYFGRHFLADVLAGGLLGGFFVLCLLFAMIALTKHDFLSTPSAYRAVLACLPLGLFVVPGADHEVIGRLLGLNAGFWLVTLSGLPIDDATPLRRSARVALAVVVYGAVSLSASYLVEAAFAEIALAEFLSKFVVTAIGFWGATVLNMKAGLFQRAPSPSSALGN